MLVFRATVAINKLNFMLKTAGCWSALLGSFPALVTN